MHLLRTNEAERSEVSNKRDGAFGILSNPNASDTAVKVYQYLCGIYCKKILAGQQESTWVNGSDDEMEYIQQITGKLPAIRGLDYIDHDFGGVNQRAAAWWERGGLVTICYHWGAPPDGLGYESSLSEIDMNEALKYGTALNKALQNEMKIVAGALLKLKEQGIPVLWRPFHEFDGKWFWWGKGGSAVFIRLWQMMYQIFTKEYGLDNLIWVLGYSHKIKRGWYPGNSYVDIVGADVYRKGSQKHRYQKTLRRFDKSKPVCYHECGPIPEPEALQRDRAFWLWFMTWHTKHIKEENTPAHLKRIYHSDYVITLDKLPDFKNK